MSIKGPIQVVLFDLGSTLIYENGPWEALYARADAALWDILRKHGVTVQPHELYGDSKTLFHLYYERYRTNLNEPTTLAVLDQLLRHKGCELPREQLRAGLRAMYGVTQTNWLPETDALPTLEAVSQRGFHIGLVSNAADDDNTQALIDKSRLRPYLEYIISSAAFGRRKPDPSIFRAALDHFQVAPGAAVMVGDSFEADIIGAHAAGMQGIWITRRTQDPGEGVATTAAEAVVATLAEIPRLLPAP